MDIFLKSGRKFKTLVDRYNYCVVELDKLSKFPDTDEAGSPNIKTNVYNYLFDLTREFGEFGMFSVAGGLKVRAIVEAAIKNRKTFKGRYNYANSRLQKLAVKEGTKEATDSAVRDSVYNYLEGASK